MFDTMLIPLDGSPLGERALPTATALAEVTGGRLVLVQAVDDDEGRRTDNKRQAEAYLQGIANRLRELGINADFAVPVGRPTDAILSQVSIQRAEIVVMATQVRSLLDRWVHGSVAEAVLAESQVPLLIVRNTGPDLPSASARPNVLVPLDGSALAETALPYASELVRAAGSSLILIQVVEPPNFTAVGGGYNTLPIDYPSLEEEERAAAKKYLSSVVERLQGQGLSAQYLVGYGLAADTIIEASGTSEVGLVVMATHGRTGLFKVLFGSVATGVLHHGRLPLLLVRPTVVSEEKQPTVSESSAMRRRSDQQL